MKINKSRIYLQIAGLFVFVLIAMASSSSKDSSSFDWRGAAVGGTAGYNGYIPIGKASSNSEACELAKSKGYNYCIWDSNNGVVYAK